VVAVRRPTSARPGAHGIIHPDGSIEGWVGGSCAQPVVVREALRSIADGQPRLLRISKELPSDTRRSDGVVELVMTCHSGGTLEIYVEPQLPLPALWICGTTPIVGALAELGSGAGFAVTVIDPIAEAEAFPAAERVATTDDLAALPATGSPYVIVATQGQWDEEAVATALRRDVAYVGLIASPTRATIVRDYLRQEGIAEDRIAALRAPAGLDLGAETAGEIAVSILAELIQVRRGRAPFVAAPGPATLSAAASGPPPPIVSSDPETLPLRPIAGAPGRGTAPGPARAVAPADVRVDDIVLLDPVCGMTVEREHVRHLAEHDGVVYAFCTLGCRTRFIKDPAAYLPSEQPTT